MVVGETTRGPPGNKESSPLPNARRLSGAAFSASFTFSAVVVMFPRIWRRLRGDSRPRLSGRAKLGYRARAQN